MRALEEGRGYAELINNGIFSSAADIAKHHLGGKCTEQHVYARLCLYGSIPELRDRAKSLGTNNAETLARVFITDKAPFDHGRLRWLLEHIFPDAKRITESSLGSADTYSWPENPDGVKFARAIGNKYGLPARDAALARLDALMSGDPDPEAAAEAAMSSRSGSGKPKALPKRTRVSMAAAYSQIGDLVGVLSESSNTKEKEIAELVQAWMNAPSKEASKGRMQEFRQASSKYNLIKLMTLTGYVRGLWEAHKDEDEGTDPVWEAHAFRRELDDKADK